jgi:hypothetical protein
MSHNQNINDQKLFYVFNKTTVSHIIALSLLNCNDLMHCSLVACHGIYVLHPFCNLQSLARTHAVLVIGLYELLGNPTT